MAAVFAVAPRGLMNQAAEGPAGEGSVGCGWMAYTETECAST